MFHGTHKEITEFAAGKMVFLTYSAETAEAYGAAVHLVDVADDANIGNEGDLREIVEGLGYDWREERAWGWVEYKKVREAAIAAGFGGFEGDDCLPGTDGSNRADQHDFTVVFNPALHCKIVGLIDL